MSSKFARLIRSAKNPSTLLYASIISTAHLVPLWVLVTELLCVCTGHLLTLPCVSSSISLMSKTAVIKWLASTPMLPESRLVEIAKLLLRQH